MSRLAPLSRVTSSASYGCTDRAASASKRSWRPTPKRPAAPVSQWHKLEGGRIRPTPAGIRAAVRHSPEVSQASTLRSSTVVIIDAAERLDAAEEWLREEYLPAMSAKTLVVIASRRPPGEPWRSDPGWRDLLRVVSLRNLLPEAVRALLDAERIPKELLGQSWH
jgi:hypothetical protein